MSRVLVISPHPDDEAIGCGGTLRSHVLASDPVRVIFLTSGENGGHGRPQDETAVRREREADEAAKILGVGPIEFWRQRDGKLRAHGPLVERLRGVFADWKPDLVYVTHDKEMHPDHRAAARLVRHALAKCRPPTPEVDMYEVWTPMQKMDRIVDISDQVEDKIAAIRAHKSQCDVVAFDAAARGLSRYRGELHSWPGGNYAEIFTRMR